MKWAIAILLIARACGAFAQGTFQNLNFEEANVVPIFGQPYAVTVANALPGWTVEYGNVQQTQIFYNDPSLGAAQVTLYANGYPGSPGPIIDGNYSLFLEGGMFEGVQSNVSISQTGQIPFGTQSILFDVANPTFQPEPLDLFIGNQAVSFSSVGSGIGNGASYTIYGANISAWAGQTEQLTFSSPGYILLDDISFSPASIPEPSPIILSGLGGLLIALYRRWFQR